MITNPDVKIARADIVGSLLRPTYLREARQGVRGGQVSEDDLRAALSGFAAYPGGTGYRWRGSP